MSRLAKDDWLQLATRTASSREAYMAGIQQLPGKIRHLLKHLDPRSNTPRNLENEIADYSEAEKAILQKLLKYHMSFPMGHKFSNSRHEGKYKSKAPNRNHLISHEEMRRFDKRKL